MAIYARTIGRNLNARLALWVIPFLHQPVGAEKDRVLTWLMPARKALVDSFMGV